MLVDTTRFATVPDTNPLIATVVINTKLGKVSNPYTFKEPFMTEEMSHEDAMLYALGLKQMKKTK